MKRVDPVRLEIAIADMRFTAHNLGDSADGLTRATRRLVDAFDEMHCELMLAIKDDPFEDDGSVIPEATEAFASCDAAIETLGMIASRP